ncbi:MAG: sarcosine oxidase subunit gamma [Paracoccaceae bacterium]
MAKLIAQPPLKEGLPLEAGTTTLRAPRVGAITSLAPFDGGEGALSEALQAAHGLAFPAPNRATSGAAARCVWTGRGQAMLMGPAPDAGLAKHAAMTDQSDAWALFRLEGADAAAVLVRLVPVDLHPAIFATGHTARTLLGHMACSLTRVGEAGFDIMVMRSMARSALHELGVAMKSVAAQRAIQGQAPEPGQEFPESALQNP